MKISYNSETMFDYSKLKARIAERGETDKSVAYAGKMTASTYSLKMNGKGVFTQDQIIKICVFLEIDFVDIPVYFFTPKV